MFLGRKCYPSGQQWYILYDSRTRLNLPIFGEIRKPGRYTWRSAIFFREPETALSRCQSCFWHYFRGHQSSLVNQLAPTKPSGRWMRMSCGLSPILSLHHHNRLFKKQRVKDCVDSKTRLCFPILSAWIADHAGHAALHGIGSKSGPKCKVPCKELGENPLKIYETRDYILYREKALRHELAEVAGLAEYFQPVGVEIGNNLFTVLSWVNPADLHKLDLLYNIYHGLFKHMMEWEEGFLKKNKRQGALDDAWKEILPYPELSVMKKAYREVTQWQEKKSTQLHPLYFGRIGVCIAKSWQFSVSRFQERFEVC